MRTRTKIVVIKLKDVLFYATAGILCIIVLFMLYILFQPKAEPTSSTIEVKAESVFTANRCCKDFPPIQKIKELT